jgi:hypothetical protein
MLALPLATILSVLSCKGVDYQKSGGDPRPRSLEGPAASEGTEPTVIARSEGPDRHISIPCRCSLSLHLLLDPRLGSRRHQVTVPSIRPPLPALLLAVPVVVDPLAAPAAAPADPDEFAVPKELVPGFVGTFAELPAPLGSLPELLRPPAFAGPFGTPLTPAVPVPAAPAFGDPTPLPVPAVGPLAAPPAEAPPADPPPALPPPPPPPPPPP